MISTYASTAGSVNTYTGGFLAVQPWQHLPSLRTKATHKL